MHTYLFEMQEFPGKQDTTPYRHCNHFCSNTMPGEISVYRSRHSAHHLWRNVFITFCALTYRAIFYMCFCIYVLKHREVQNKEFNTIENHTRTFRPTSNFSIHYTWWEQLKSTCSSISVLKFSRFRGEIIDPRELASTKERTCDVAIILFDHRNSGQSGVMFTRTPNRVGRRSQELRKEWGDVHRINI